MQVLADGKVDPRCVRHRRIGLRGDLCDRGRKPQKLECCHIEGKLIGYPCRAEPPRLSGKEDLLPRCQHARERTPQGSDASAMAGDGAVEVRYCRPVAQKPERLRVYKALDHLIEGELVGTLDLAVERIDALPERR